jgi:hypothetical protein
MIKLKFVEETTSLGNVVSNANISGKLLSISDKVFEYVSPVTKDTVFYKLATMSFKDLNGDETTTDRCVIYETSYDKGMELGKNYLGKITLNKEPNEDGSRRQPWIMLSSFVKGQEISFDDFEFAD